MNSQKKIISMVLSNKRILKDLFEYFKIQHFNLPCFVFETLGEVIDDLELIKTEERKLSQRERVKLLQESWKNNGIGAGDEEVSTLWVEYNNLMTKYNIPTKLITITYKNEKIEVYE